MTLICDMMASETSSPEAGREATDQKATDQKAVGREVTGPEVTNHETTDREGTGANGQGAHSGATPAPVDGIKADGIEVIRQPNRRFLFNRSGLAIRRMWLTDRVISYQGGIEFPSPIYEVRDLPAGSYMQLPGWDKYLDGITTWTLTEVEWEDGTSLSEPVYRGEHKRWGGARFDEQLVEREATLIACTLGRDFEPPQ